MRERDNQREKCYRAERQSLHPIWEPLPTVKDVERYLKKQSKRATLRSRYGHAVDVSDWKLRVKDGRGTRNALAYEHYAIGIPLWARNDVVVLHEWAHVIHKRISRYHYMSGVHGASRVKELGGGAAHGWQWAAIFIDLLHFCKGKDAADAFKAALRKNNARWTPKKKRPISEEQRQVLRDRLAKARALKKDA